MLVVSSHVRISVKNAIAIEIDNPHLIPLKLTAGREVLMFSLYTHGGKNNELFGLLFLIGVSDHRTFCWFRCSDDEKRKNLRTKTQ